MSFQQRLLKQLELSAAKEDELLRQSRGLAQHAADHQGLEERIKVAKEGKEKVDQLKGGLNKQIEDIQAEWTALVKEDEKLRKELSDSFAAQINGLNEKMQGDVSRGSALEENARLKEQIKILEENSETTGPKFDELIATREKETGSIQERLGKEMAQEKELLVKIEEQKNLLPPAQEAYDEIKAKVDDYVERFAKIQEALTSANATFTKSRAEQERMVKKIQTTEKEAADARKRAERSKVDFEQEAAIVGKYEAQLATLEEQTVKLRQLTQTFNSQVVDAHKHEDPMKA